MAATDLLVSLLGLENSEKIQKCRKTATPGSRDPAEGGGSGKTFFFRSVG